jgi:hypothetical protein
MKELTRARWKNGKKILFILWKVKREIVSMGDCFIPTQVADFHYKCSILLEYPKNNISGRSPQKTG